MNERLKKNVRRFVLLSSFNVYLFTFQNFCFCCRCVFFMIFFSAGDCKNASPWATALVFNFECIVALLYWSLASTIYVCVAGIVIGIWSLQQCECVEPDSLETFYSLLSNRIGTLNCRRVISNYMRSLKSSAHFGSSRRLQIDWYNNLCNAYFRYRFGVPSFHSFLLNRNEQRG